MDNSFPADGGQSLPIAKRKASEEAKPAPDAKRVEGFDDKLTESDDPSPVTTQRVFFPEKVCWSVRLLELILTRHSLQL